MPFDRTDFDLVLPAAARQALRGWLPGHDLTRAELVADRGVEPDQVDRLLMAFEAVGLGRRTGRDLRRTRQPVCLLAADLGGTKLHMALVDETGAALAERIEPTAPGGVTAVIDQIVRLRAGLLAATKLAPSAILGAAMGVPGALHPKTRRIALAPNIPGLDEIDLAAVLQQRLSHPVRIENDVNLAALGEQAEGAAQTCRDFAFIALGTGIGMGLVLDGRLLRGHSGMAGEIALLPLGTDPHEPDHDRHGPLETAIGSSGILAAARHAGETRAATVEELFAEARAGQRAARHALDLTVRVLLEAILSVRAIVDPECVVIGGGIGVQPEIIEALQALAKRYRHAPMILPSALGPRAVLAGAAHLGLSEMVRIGLTTRALKAEASGAWTEGLQA